MLKIEKNKSLKAFNTFGIDAKARSFVATENTAEILQILKEYPNEQLFILGGGSNMLLINDINALVVHINSKGIEIVSENEETVHLKVMSGENWHDLVQYCIQHNYGGVENLSLIPGNVGTAPIQNIGAYGVELKDVFISCEAAEIATNKIKTFSNQECQFGYRNSIFKNQEKGKYIITSVTFELTKKNHKIQTNYGAIEAALASKNINDPSIADVSEAVIAIRQSKLPDPKELGNSGSFFKNPVVDASTFQNFRLRFPKAPFYEVSPTQFKIPAGWLIEQTGLKGKRFGDAGVHAKQALVLVNYGNASGQDIWDLAQLIQKKVKDQFDIYIEPEVNII